MCLIAKVFKRIIIILDIEQPVAIWSMYKNNDIIIMISWAKKTTHLYTHVTSDRFAVWCELIIKLA